MIDPDDFGFLSGVEQARYLGLLSVEVDEWLLSGKQLVAEGLAGRVDELLYGGAAGGGKSEWLLWHVLRLAEGFERHRSLVLRSSFPELRRTLIQRSIVLFAGSGAVWRAADKEWRFPNGSVIEFGFCESDDDVRQFLSAEYDCVALDEGTEFTSYQAEMLRSRLRTTKRKRLAGVRPHMVLCSNPGGRGHKWVKERFVDPVMEEAGRLGVPAWEAVAELRFRLDDGRETVRTVGFVPATAYDNPHIDPGYIDSLLQLSEPLRKQYLDGSWDSFEGMYFPEFDRGKHGAHSGWHVCEPFPIPHHWPRTVGVDYGYVAPFAAVWVAFNPDSGEAFVYREAKESGLTVGDQAKLVRSLSRSRAESGGVQEEQIGLPLLDPSCWRKEGSGQSLAQQYAKNGLVCRQADNRRVDGWQRVREWLHTVELETPDGPLVTPALKVFSTCPRLVDEIVNARHDKNRPEDLDTKGDDHLLDALRYALMARPPKPHSRTRHLLGRAERAIHRYEARLSKPRRQPVLPTH